MAKTGVAAVNEQQFFNAEILGVAPIVDIVFFTRSVPVDTGFWTPVAHWIVGL